MLKKEEGKLAKLDKTDEGLMVCESEPKLYTPNPKH
jgi:hypothetical protein